MEANAPNLFCY